MPEISLRFGVATGDGRTSDVWKVWVNSGTGKCDVYMTSRRLGNAVKLSLHEDGQWHVSFDSNKKDVLFDPGKAPATRFLGKWQRPDSLARPYVLAACVYVPWFSPSATPREAPNEIVWIANAPENQSVEVSVFLLSSAVTRDGWPGRDSSGTRLVGELPLDNDGRVCVVHRTTSTWPAVSAATGSLSLFAGTTQANLLEANRGVFWGEVGDGSIAFVELPVMVKKQSAG